MIGLKKRKQTAVFSPKPGRVLAQQDISPAMTKCCRGLPSETTVSRTPNVPALPVLIRKH